MLDFAGIDKPAHLRGISAAPRPMGRTDGPHHDWIVVQTHHHHGLGTIGEVHGRMVRSARYKYVCYDRGQPYEQLFDMDADPGEMNDLTLSDEPAARRTPAEHRAMPGRYVSQTGDFLRVPETS